MFKLSKGNSKLGNIANINISTEVCRVLKMPCYTTGCYARKGNYLYKNVVGRLEENLQQWVDDPTEFFNQLTLQLSKLSKGDRVRWHASGEIVNSKYFNMMLEVALHMPDLKFLCYTKRYSIINNYLNTGATIPDNLTIVFSAWDGLPMDNSYSLPIAVVIPKDSIYSLGYKCTGSCATCSTCWELKTGQLVLFKKH